MVILLDEIKNMKFSQIMANDAEFNMANALNLIKSAASGNEHVFQMASKE